MKKVLLLSLVLALVMALVLPTAVMAAKPVDFAATGKFISIDEGDVTALDFYPGTEIVSLWQVQNRHIYGEFERSVKGEANRLNGPFTITYDAVVDSYQAGDFTGTLKAKSATFKIEGTSWGITGFDPELGYQITLTGLWKGTKGIKGNGEFYADFYFVPTADGLHIAYLTDSTFTMTGQYDR